MSLLNRPSDGIYSVLAVIWKLLLERKNMDEEQLLNLCAPPNAGDQAMVRSTLNTWTQLGLLLRVDGKVGLAKEDLMGAGQSQESQSCQSRILRRLVLLPENNERLVQEDNVESRSADFTRAVCWMLAQDTYTLPTRSYKDVEVHDIRQWTSGLRAFQNDTRWSGYQDWATALGFGWIAPRLKTIGGLITDPTLAVRDALPEVFGKKNELHQRDFLSRLAETLPVIDGGEYRRSVEEHLDPRQWHRPDEHELSPSLSLALLRLETAGILRLRMLSDADKRMLLGREFRPLPLHSFSHVVFAGVS